jgi:hypothetical protein
MPSNTTFALHKPSLLVGPQVKYVGNNKECIALSTFFILKIEAIIHLTLLFGIFSILSIHLTSLGSAVVEKKKKKKKKKLTLNKG